MHHEGVGVRYLFNLQDIFFIMVSGGIALYLGLAKPSGSYVS